MNTSKEISNGLIPVIKAAYNNEIVALVNEADLTYVTRESCDDYDREYVSIYFMPFTSGEIGLVKIKGHLRNTVASHLIDYEKAVEIIVKFKKYHLLDDVRFLKLSQFVKNNLLKVIK